MSDHPLILQGPLVRSLLEGRKKQTRRPLTRSTVTIDGPTCPKQLWGNLDIDSGWVDPGPSPAGNPGPYLHAPNTNRQMEGCVHRVYPRGHVGDRLWVRETWGMSYVDIASDRAHVEGGTWGSPARPMRQACVVFRADGDAMPDDSPGEPPGAFRPVSASS